MKEFYIQPQKEKIFYYVFIPGTGEPKRKHNSLRLAKTEAQRLAYKTGKEVFILQAMKKYKVGDLIETNFQHNL